MYCGLLNPVVFAQRKLKAETLHVFGIQRVEYLLNDQIELLENAVSDRGGGWMNLLGICLGVFRRLWF